MASKSKIGPVVDGLAVLASVAEAVPVLGAPVKGAVEALKHILEYTEVSNLKDSSQCL
jgi:hypothetical protein